jgi:SAM-dependent methyltransferase
VEPAAPKPAHLGPVYGAQFSDAGVVAAYGNRPPYPPALFAILDGLARDTPRVALDAGCGRGELARPLSRLLRRVDALDPAAGMIAAGRALPDGDRANLRWIVGAAEDAPLDPPYALITAGASLHWMEWAVVLPRFAAALTPGGALALVDRVESPPPWHADLLALITRHSTNREYQPYDLVRELTQRGLFTPAGSERTAAEPFEQPLAAYIESLHSMNGLSRDRMPAESAAAFDAAVQALVAPHAADGVVRRDVAARVVWGRPGGQR